MLLRTAKLVLVLLLMLLATPTAWGQVDEWKMVHGDVLQVFSEQHKILVECADGRLIFNVEPECQILRMGIPTSLESLRPVTSDDFQDVLCWINGQGTISYIFVNYSVREKDGILVTYDIFGNLK